MGVIKLSNEQLLTNNTIVNMRTLLHQYIYTAEFVNIISNELQNSLELFSINTEGTIITLKIKKTILKKSAEYQHDSLYYYGIMNDIIYRCIYANIEHISNTIAINTDLKKNDIIANLTNPFNIHMLYNITALGDNIVIIYL